jgi:hypothetical protein
MGDDDEMVATVPQVATMEQRYSLIQLIPAQARHVVTFIADRQ